MRITVTKTTKYYEVWHLEAPDREAAFAQLRTNPREPDEVFTHHPVVEARRDENEAPGPRPIQPWDDRAKGEPR